MIANALAVAIGLWLTYSAIFSKPAGEMNNIELAIAAAVIVVCAFISRRSDRMNWQSTTNIALGLLLGLLAAGRAYFTETPLSPFWTILLTGIAVAILALWSILYRRDQAAGSISA